MKFFILIFFILCLSCQRENRNAKKISNTHQSLIGTWSLDSLTFPTGNTHTAQSTGKSMTLRLEENGHFILERWLLSDVGNQYEGIYSLTYNPDQNKYVFHLSPDPQHFDSTEIQQYFNFEVSYLSIDQMILIEPTEKLDRTPIGGEPKFIYYNRKNYLHRADSIKFN